MSEAYATMEENPNPDKGIDLHYVMAKSNGQEINEMNTTQKDINQRNLEGNAQVVQAEYRLVKLPRGFKGRCIYVLLHGKRKMQPTNMLEIDGVDVWADSLFTKFSPSQLNAAEKKAYSLAN